LRGLAARTAIFQGFWRPEIPEISNFEMKSQWEAKSKFEAHQPQNQNIKYFENFAIFS
jgi:hypothetical protein